MKSSAVVKKELQQMAKFEAEELARYDKKHPTRTAPENSVKNTGRKQKERIRQKAKYVRVYPALAKTFLVPNKIF